MNELTVIITFRNEGEEVEYTVSEIKRTAGEQVDIILVNDASEDQCDYRGIVKKYSRIQYLENSRREGCAASREIGVKECRTPYLFIIDAHMRFYSNQWWLKIVEAIKVDSRAVYCCRCVVWDYETKQEQDITSPYAACMNLTDKDYIRRLDVYWITEDLSPGEVIVDVPCVLGACYAASKEYWHYLRGLEGLRLYSYDEAFLSLKVWMEGGKCRLLKEVAVGHLFRQKFPYQILNDEFHYNRIFVASTLLPEEYEKKIMQEIRLETDCIGFARLKRLLEQHRQEIDELKEYFQMILTAGFERFAEFNTSVQKRCVQDNNDSI